MSLILGTVDQITQQPVKGRKMAGGIRFGEMERDALVAHGCAILVQDRLLLSSDVTQAYVCETCGSLLSVTKFTEGSFTTVRRYWKCLQCDSKENITLVEIPFVYKYLVSELASMNIKTIMKLK